MKYKIARNKKKKGLIIADQAFLQKYCMNLLVHAVLFKFFAKSTAVDTHHSCCASLVTASVLHDGI